MKLFTFLYQPWWTCRSIFQQASHSFWFIPDYSSWVFFYVSSVNEMVSMFGIWSPCIFTYSSQAKNTCLSLSEKYATLIYMMMTWENRLSSGWSLWDIEKMMEPPDTLNTLSAKWQCLCFLFRIFSWIVHLHPAHSLYPTKFHIHLGRWDYLSQKGFYSLKSHLFSKPTRPITGTCISAGHLLVSSWLQIFF